MYYERRRLVVADLELHSVVALLEDLSAEGLLRGQVGTVVENWAPGVYEVEFFAITRAGCTRWLR
jgi:hypothetical protein